MHSSPLPIFKESKIWFVTSIFRTASLLFNFRDYPACAFVHSVLEREGSCRKETLPRQRTDAILKAPVLFYSAKSFNTLFFAFLFGICC